VDTNGHDVPMTANIIRFSDEPEPLDRPAKPEPVTIGHDPPPTTH
jgi:hypothetical protein